MDKTGIKQLTRAQARAMFRRAVKQALNIDPQTYLVEYFLDRKHRACDPKLVRLAMLIPFAR